MAVKTLALAWTCLFLTIPCNADIIYVKQGGTGSGTSWADAYGDLQDGLDDAEPNDVVWVAKGTYKPSVEIGGTGDRYKTFQMKNGVKIYGGFPDTGYPVMADHDPVQFRTVLSGDVGTTHGHDPNDYCYHVFYHPNGTNLDSTAILDGFTVTSGNANSVGGGDHWYGGGMFNYSSSPTVINCTFTGNSADYGGGMYNWDSDPNLTDCEFVGNWAKWGGGGMCNYRDCTVSMVNCTFTENSQTREDGDGGGAIFNYTGNTLILNSCTFTHNSAQKGGGGILNGHYDGGGQNNISLRNCSFSGNFARDGGGIDSYSGQINMVNCTFTENRSHRQGGAIYTHHEDTINIDNCIFIKNISRGSPEHKHGGDGGAIFLFDSYFKITNSIFIDNTSLCDKDIVLEDIYDIIFDTGSGGAVCIFYSRGVIDSCLFTGNSSGIAGGLYLGGDHETEYNDILLNNCTIVGNSARYYGGGLFLDGYVEATNCIIRDNRAMPGPQIASWYLDSTISYCDVQGGQEEIFLWDIWGEASIDWGQGNIDTDPRFVDSGYWNPNATPVDPNDDFWVDGDYHLNWLSPCFNAGDPCGYYKGQTDMDDKPRVRYDRIDMGAYEVFPLACDFEPDEDVDLVDFAKVTDQWQSSTYNKFSAPDGEEGDNFGISVSIDQNVFVVGARWDDDAGDDSGSAYIFRRNNAKAEWVFEQKLTALDALRYDDFGFSVSVSRNVCVIGARGDDSSRGSAYIFRFNGSNWVQEAKLVADERQEYDIFGNSVSVCNDTCIVGGWGFDDYGQKSGSAYVFRFDGEGWRREQKLLAADGAAGDHFGGSVAIFKDVCIVGAGGDDDNGISSGSAYIFRFDGSEWIEEQKLLAPDGTDSDRFGVSVSVQNDVCIMGAWSDNDNGIDSGSAYVFRFDGTDWVFEQKLLASDGEEGDWFGNRVSIEEDASVIGASTDNDNGEWSGSAYIFRFDGDRWIQTDKLIAFDGAEDDRFGYNVSLSSGNVIVSSVYDDDNGIRSGSVYVFHLWPDVDFNDDSSVDMDDLVIFARYWLANAGETMAVELTLDHSWMYQNVGSSTNSNLTANVSIVHDPQSNTSYTFDWEIILPDDVTVEPATIGGGEAGDTSWNFAAPNVNQPGGLSDSGQAITVRVTVTGADFGNTGTAEAQFGVALLGDVNNDSVVNVADRGIINAFWRTGAAEGFSLRDCDLNCDGTVNIADRSIANAIWRGQLGQNQVSNTCPFR